MAPTGLHAGVDVDAVGGEPGRGVAAVFVGVLVVGPEGDPAATPRGGHSPNVVPHSPLSVLTRTGSESSSARARRHQATHRPSCTGSAPNAPFANDQDTYLTGVSIP